MSSVLFITHFLNGLLMILIPIGIGIYLSRRFNPGWRLWLIGAGVFILSQVGHIPFNLGLTSLFKSGILPVPPEGYRLAFNAILLGLSAGVWEEMARYAAFRWWAKDARAWSKSLMMGAGHGGVEAILFGVLVLINYIVMVAIRGTDFSTAIPAEQLALLTEQVSSYWSIPWYGSLLGALERLFAVVIQISLSVLVLQAFTRHKLVWLGAAILWHAAIDAASVYTAGAWGAYTAELVIGVLALVSLIFIIRLRQPEELTVGGSPLPSLSSEAVHSILSSPAITEEVIEDSRYI